MQDILTVIVGIIVEATPFVVLGTMLAVAVQKYALFDKILQRMPENVFLRRPVVALIGVALPVCECGNIPLARGLMRKGFSTAEAVTFLLAAPILNPITFITTYEAFRNVPWMTPARMIGGLCIALVVGELVGRFGKKALTKQFAKTCEPSDSHIHNKSFSLMFGEEFWQLFKLLCIGATIAGITQYILTQDAFSGVGENYLLGVLIMVALALVVSICSSVDAFFALAYAGTFRYGALLAFLLVGPMMDIKVLVMLKNTFSKRAIAVLALSAIMLGSLMGIGFSYVG